MKTWTISILLCFSWLALAEDDNMAALSLLKPGSTFKVDKSEIRKSLQMMKSNGQLSESDYLKALKEVDGMDDKKIDDINKKAQDMIKTDPNKAEAETKKNLSTP